VAKEKRASLNEKKGGGGGYPYEKKVHSLRIEVGEKAGGENPWSEIYGEWGGIPDIEEAENLRL